MQKLDENGNIFISEPCCETRAHSEIRAEANKEIKKEFNKYVNMQSGLRSIDLNEYLTISWPKDVPEILRDLLYYLARFYYEKPIKKE